MEIVGRVAERAARMPSKPRIEIAGAVYHVLSQADHGGSHLPGRPGPDSVVGDARGGVRKDGWAVGAQLFHLRRGRAGALLERGFEPSRIGGLRQLLRGGGAGRGDPWFQGQDEGRDTLC